MLMLEGRHMMPAMVDFWDTLLPSMAMDRKGGSTKCFTPATQYLVRPCSTAFLEPSCSFLAVPELRKSLACTSSQMHPNLMTNCWNNQKAGPTVESLANISGTDAFKCRLSSKPKAFQVSSIRCSAGSACR